MAETCVKRRISADKHVKGARAGVPGLTFKEDVPDIRNTRVVDIIAELKEYGIIPLVHDPEADVAEAIAFISHPEATTVQGQVLRVCGLSLLGA